MVGFSKLSLAVTVGAVAAASGVAADVQRVGLSKRVKDAEAEAYLQAQIVDKIKALQAEGVKEGKPLEQKLNENDAKE